MNCFPLQNLIMWYPCSMETSNCPITIRQALDRGFWTVQIPSMVLMFTPGLVLAAVTERQDWIGNKGLALFLPTFLGGFFLGWLAWSILVPRWRLWAYQRVANIDELKFHAAASQLIWPEGHFFERTEIASKKVRKELKALEAKT